MSIPLGPFKPRIEGEYSASMRNYLIAKGSRLSNLNPGSRTRTILDAISRQLARSDLEVFLGFDESVVSGLYKAFGFERLPGNRSTGYVRIESTGHTSDIVLPIGTTIDLFGFVFETTAAVTLPVLSTEVEVDVRAVRIGSEFNIEPLKIDTSEGLGTISVQLPSSARLFNPVSFTGGTNQESEESRLTRFQSFINSLGRSTVLGITFAVNSIPGVVGSVVETNVNPFTRIPETGWINIFVSDGTVTPPQTLLDLVEKTIVGDPNDAANFPGYAAAGTLVYVAPVTVFALDCSVEVVIANGSSLLDSEAEILILNAITSYVNTLPLGQDVLFDTLKAKIITAHPDILKVNMLAPLADVSIDFSALPRIGGSSGGVVTISFLPREVPT